MFRFEVIHITRAETIDDALQDLRVLPLPRYKVRLALSRIQKAARLQTALKSETRELMHHIT